MSVRLAPNLPEGEEGEGQAVGSSQTDGLSEFDEKMLAFERQWWRFAGSKEQAIRDEFGVSTTRYYQMLNNLIDTRAALESDPLLVKRLQRLRSSRQQARSARRLAA